MPIIVPIEDNKVGSATATDAKFRAPDYSGSGLEALGAGVVQLGAGLEERRRRAAEAIAAAMLDDRHQSTIDDAAVKKAYVDYSDPTHEALHGEDGLFNQQGADAHAAFPGLVEKLVDNHDKALSKLDDVQRGAVAPAMNERLRSDVARAAEHVRQQGAAEQKWQSEQLQKAAARDAMNHADDPDLFDHHLATGENTIRQQAKIDNVGDRLLDKQLADYRSNVTSAMIDALAARDPAQAADWFAQRADNLSQRDKVRIAASLTPMLTEAQATAAGLDVQSIPAIYRPGVAPLASASPSSSPETMEALQPGVSVGRPAYRRRSEGTGAAIDAGGRMSTVPVATTERGTALPPETVLADDGDVAVLRPTERRAPLVSGEVDGQVVLAAKVAQRDAARLNGRDIVVTPEMRAIAQANIDKVRVRAGNKEKTAVAYLMPDGTIQVRPLDPKHTKHGSGDGGDYMSGHTSGPGRPLFVIHGHIEKNTDFSSGLFSGASGDYGMVDNILDPNAEGYGDTHSLMRLGIPVATVYNGYIGWHEMRGGQLIFSAPKAAFSHGQAGSLQDNLNSEQNKFLTPRPRRRSR
jgi:hypothetical protein